MELDQELIRRKLLGKPEISPTAKEPSFTDGGSFPTDSRYTGQSDGFSHGLPDKELPTEARLTNMTAKMTILSKENEVLGQEIQRLKERINAIIVRLKPLLPKDPREHGGNF